MTRYFPLTLRNLMTAHLMLDGNIDIRALIVIPLNINRITQRPVQLNHRNHQTINEVYKNLFPCPCDPNLTDRGTNRDIVLC
jgi:hypothetical protein